MKTENVKRNRLWAMAAMVVVLFVALAAMPVAAQDANPLNPQNILNIPVINKQRVSINETTAPGTYFFDIGNNLTNGGQNAVHVTDTNATPNGIFHNSSILNPSDVDMLNGSFYISDTGGKGYEDEAILSHCSERCGPRYLLDPYQIRGLQIYRSRTQLATHLSESNRNI